MISEIVNQCLKKVLLNRDSTNKNEPLRYLEVGVHKGDTFKVVNENIEGVSVIKEGVDPYGSFDDGRVFRMTSQVYFALNEHFWKKKYDVIFLDGMHFSLILNQEIEQSLKILNTDGIIILDDTIPSYEESGKVEVNSFVNWCKLVSYPLFNNYSDEGEDNYKYVKEFPGYPHAKGDCWKSVVNLRMSHPEIMVGSFIEGERPVTLLSGKGGQLSLSKISEKEINWDFFQKNFNEIFCPIKKVDEMFK